MVIHFISYQLIVHYIPHCLWTTWQAEEKVDTRS